MVVSANFKRDVYDPETGEAFLALLTIDHAAISPPIRAVNNLEDVVSRGDTTGARGKRTRGAPV